MYGWLAALVEGFTKGLVSLYQAWQQRKDTQDAALNAKRADDTAATLDIEREIHDALDKDRADRRPVTWADIVRDHDTRDTTDHGSAPPPRQPEP